MKGKRHIVKGMAIVLLLAFSQKIGIGLYLHNLLHTTNSQGSLPDQASKNKAVSYNCSCIDDFLLPFSKTTIEIISPETHTTAIFISFYPKAIPFSFQIFNSLRGPPSLFA